MLKESHHRERRKMLLSDRVWDDHDEDNVRKTILDGLEHSLIIEYPEFSACSVAL